MDEQISWGVDAVKYQRTLKALVANVAAAGVNGAMIELLRRVEQHDQLCEALNEERSSQIRALNNTALAALRREVIEGMSLTVESNVDHLEYLALARNAAVESLEAITWQIIDAAYDGAESINSAKDQVQHAQREGLIARLRRRYADVIYSIARFVEP